MFTKMIKDLIRRRIEERAKQMLDRIIERARANTLTTLDERALEAIRDVDAVDVILDLVLGEDDDGVQMDTVEAR